MRIRRSISLVLVLTMLLSVFATYYASVLAEDGTDTGVLLFEEDFNYAVDSTLDSLGWETAATYSIQNAKENSTVFEGLALSDTCAQLDAGEGPMAFEMDETYGGSETLWASAIVRANSGMGCISLGMHSNAWSCKDNVERITLGSFPGWMGSPGEGSLSLILQTEGEGALTEEQINSGVRAITSKYQDMRSQDTLYLIKVEYPNGTSTKVSVWLNPGVGSEPTGEPDISAELAGVVHINTIGTHLGWASGGVAQLDAVRLGTSFRAVLPLADGYEVPPQVEPTDEPAEPTEKPAEPTEEPAEPTPTPAVEKVTVEYKDINNNVAKSVDVVKGEAIGTLPKMFRDGYVFEGWSLDGDKIDETFVVEKEIALKPMFTKETTSTSIYKINIGDNVEYSKVNGIGFVDGMQNELTLADKVVFKMKAAEGKEVDYWTINGQVVSNEQTLSFMVQPGTMNVDVVLKAVGAENTKTVDPDVIITSTVSRPDHNNRFYVYAMRILAADAKLVECGVIVKRNEANEVNIELKDVDNQSVFAYKSSKQGEMGEYVIVRKDNVKDYCVRSYLKYTDSTGDHVVYSDAQTVTLDVVQ